MGLLDRKRKHEGSERKAIAGNGNGAPPPSEPRPLTDAERETLIAQAREDLQQLDRSVEGNIARLRELSKS